MAGCTICQRSDVAAINAALAAGEGLGTVSRRHGVPKTTLQRHRGTCPGASAKSAEAQGQAVPEPVPRRSGGRPREAPGESAGAQEREARVRLIMRLMADHRWEQDSAARYAEEWGVHPGTVTSYAGEAARRLLNLADDKVLSDVWMAGYSELQDLALDAARTRDPKAISAAAQVFRVWLDRLKAPSAPEKDATPPTFKIDLSLPVRPPPEQEPN